MPSRSASKLVDAGFKHSAFEIVEPVEMLESRRLSRHLDANDLAGRKMLAHDPRWPT
jgi:hypothetical protein